MTATAEDADASRIAPTTIVAIPIAIRPNRRPCDVDARTTPTSGLEAFAVVTLC